MTQQESTAMVHIPQGQPIQLSTLRTHPQLNQEAFQHPDDRKATDALQCVPVFPQIVKFFAGGLTETAMRLHHLSHCIRVGPNQAVELYRHFVRAAEVLSLPDLPELFISPDDAVNAYAMGIKEPTIVITRGLAEAMDMGETMAVLAHELGHVKCRHMVNKTIASMIAKFGMMGISQFVPMLGTAAMLAIQAPLCHWSRMAEISCDRAALLVVQDPKIVAGMLAKIGGWPKKLGQIEFQSLREQTEEYDRLDDNAVASILKIINMLDSGLYLTHPLPINRVHRILEWSESEHYRSILTGDYARLEQELPKRRCGECGTVVGPADRVCCNCGHKIKVDPRGPACPQCGASVPTPCPKFCARCGHNFAQFRSTTA